MTTIDTVTAQELAAFEKAYGFHELNESQRMVVKGSCLGSFLDGYRAAAGNNQTVEIEARAKMESLFDNLGVLSSEWKSFATRLDKRNAFAEAMTLRENAEQLQAKVRTMRITTKIAKRTQRVGKWLLDCFGNKIAHDRTERNYRFFEEAAELVQATGMTREEAHQLVDYTFNRPVGEVKQEIGGVFVTLAALCFAHEIDMDECGEMEISRIMQPDIMEKIRIKQQSKPHKSPLPQPVEAESAQTSETTTDASVKASTDLFDALVDKAMYWFTPEMLPKTRTSMQAMIGNVLTALKPEQDEFLTDEQEFALARVREFVKRWHNENKVTRVNIQPEYWTKLRMKDLQTVLDIFKKDPPDGTKD